jgi:hypothetical protein
MSAAYAQQTRELFRKRLRPRPAEIRGPAQARTAARPANSRLSQVTSASASWPRTGSQPAPAAVIDAYGPPYRRQQP